MISSTLREMPERKQKQMTANEGNRETNTGRAGTHNPFQSEGRKRGDKTGQSLNTWNSHRLSKPTSSRPAIAAKRVNSRASHVRRMKQESYEPLRRKKSDRASGKEKRRTKTERLQTRDIQRHITIVSAEKGAKESKKLLMHCLNETDSKTKL